ncbi:NUDIX domain-containing protein [Kamptonema cortianum]|nr:NUDIX domain-containing protein [Oscillatoria laete-virens]MDK3156407.1 NUDIX domain-containing protein [Kamptonema cortianum]MDL5046266.1 NUDIX domain-containing protein [Oscillatoria amoena NRMC-F 0135]MDL5053913.1 NUDIX domain-containing protein [Oscillatoria laete-virens NRMC-F 0139]
MTSPLLPHKITTLLYCFNEADEVLLLERTKSPNQGLWSPPGGKLESGTGESPYQCAVREAREEIGLSLVVHDLRLAGLVAEKAYEGKSHWLMFLFEVRPRLRKLPPAHEEGRFAFVPRGQIARLAIPDTDREKLWDYFWKYRQGFFSLSCERLPDGRHLWVDEEIKS